MLRGLYRFYLYSVFIAMLLFATTGVIQLLTVLFQNIFKEPYNTPSAASLVQAMVFGIVALVVATLFGGLHYWLIRRDMQNDPMAGNSAVRSFFLNAVELVILPWAVGSGASTISATWAAQLCAGISVIWHSRLPSLGYGHCSNWNAGAPRQVLERLLFSRGYTSTVHNLFSYPCSHFTGCEMVGELVDSIIFGGAGFACHV